MLVKMLHARFTLSKNEVLKFLGSLLVNTENDYIFYLNMYVLSTPFLRKHSVQFTEFGIRMELTW